MRPHSALLVLLLCSGCDSGAQKPAQPAPKSDRIDVVVHADEIARPYCQELERRYLAELQDFKRVYDKNKAAVDARPKTSPTYQTGTALVASTAKVIKSMIDRGPKRVGFDGQYELKVGRAAYVSGLKVHQILGPRKFLTAIGDLNVIASGWDTADVVDGQTVRPADAVAVTGTADYTAVTGANKRVFVVEPFDLGQYTNGYRPDVPSEILDVVKQP